jgi:hypothetical protein
MERDANEARPPKTAPKLAGRGDGGHKMTNLTTADATPKTAGETDETATAAESHGALKTLGPFLIERWLRDAEDEKRASSPLGVVELAMADLLLLGRRGRLKPEEAWAWARSEASALALGKDSEPVPFARLLLEREHSRHGGERQQAALAFWGWMRQSSGFHASDRIDGCPCDAATLAIRHSAFEWAVAAIERTPMERWNTDWAAEFAVTGYQDAETGKARTIAMEHAWFGGPQEAVAAREKRSKGFLKRLLGGPQGWGERIHRGSVTHTQRLLAQLMRYGFADAKEIGQWLASDELVTIRDGVEQRQASPLEMFAEEPKAWAESAKITPTGFWERLFEADAIDWEARPRARQKRLSIGEWAILLRNAELSQAIAKRRPEAFGEEFDVIAMLLTQSSSQEAFNGHERSTPHFGAMAARKEEAQTFAVFGARSGISAAIERVELARSLREAEGRDTENGAATASSRPPARI